MGEAMTVAGTGVGLWLPDYPCAEAWRTRTPLPPDEPQKPKGAAFDRVNRRRASTMGRALGDAVGEAMAMAGVDPAQVPTVIGSAIGEASAMIGLLEQMWRTKEPMSPAVFTVSVHNAASGLLSISMKNRGFTTSIAADYDTPAAALLEAIGLIAAGHDAVVVACADEGSPRSLLAHAPHWDMLAAAVVLARAGAPNAIGQLAMANGLEPTLPPAALADGVGHNPQAGFADLVDTALRRASGVLALDRGHGRGYRVRFEAAP